MNPTIASQAAKSAQQGQQLLDEDNAKSAQAKTDYTTYSQQATDANKNLQDEATYMQGAGSGLNVYNKQLGDSETAAGYNPAQLSDANKTLFSLTGAMNGANTQFNTAGGVGAYGVGAPALAGYESSILQPLTTGVANANTQVGTLNNELQTFQTGASQATTGQVQSEQATVTALTNAVQNYQSQASSALQNMQFYSQLASTQGGLNASEQQSYAQAQQAYAAAQQAIAQSKYILAQTTGQNIANQAAQNQLNIAKPAAASAPAVPTTPIRKNGSVPATNAPNPVGEFFSNPGELGKRISSGIGNFGGSILNGLSHLPGSMAPPKPTAANTRPAGAFL